MKSGKNHSLNVERPTFGPRRGAAGAQGRLERGAGSRATAATGEQEGTCARLRGNASGRKSTCGTSPTLASQLCFQLRTAKTRPADSASQPCGHFGLEGDSRLHIDAHGQEEREHVVHPAVHDHRGRAHQTREKTASRPPPSASPTSPKHRTQALCRVRCFGQPERAQEGPTRHDPSTNGCMSSDRTVA